MARICFLTVPLVLAALARTVSAAEGSLDPTFGAGGKLVGNSGEATAIAVYPDGRLLLGGGRHNFGLARYHPDGTLDTSLGGDGTVSTSGEGEQNVSDVVIQGDGKIVAVGYALDANVDLMRLIRYHADGTIDASYGTAGRVTVSFPGGAVSGRAVLQPDGKLLDVAIEHNGGGATYSIALARFNSDGSLDAGFGAGGTTVTNFPDVGEYGTAVVLAPDGKFYVVGAASTQTEYYESKWLIVRHNADGSLDTTYGDGGRVIEGFYDPYARSARASGAALLPDGKLVVGGDADGFLALMRFDANGNLDPTFGEWGKVVVRSFPHVDAAGLARRADGKIFLAATSYRGPEDVYSPQGFGLMAFEANGRVDATFAACPQVSTSFGTDEARARRLVLQADGKPIVVGGLDTEELAMARYGTASTPVCQPAASGRSSLALRDFAADARDSLKWGWQGSPVAPADLGDPTSTTGYTVCVLDGSSGQPTLRLGSPMLRADWSTSPTARTFRVASESDFPFTKAQLKATSGAGKFKIGAKGEYLYPSLPLTLPVTVRLVRDDADACWEATYSTATRNESARFAARSD